ncbi:ATP-binding protein, partial [bacterium]|nr:ATP-binding protein [bacterium]
VYASQASDGLLLFLAYLTIAYAHGDVGVLLIEEPERGVHPRRLADIVRLLRAISRGELGLPPVQVIATSHSPYLIDQCDKEEIVVFERDENDDVSATPLSAVENIDERLEDFAPGELIYTMGEGICGSRS